MSEQWHAKDSMVLNMALNPGGLPLKNAYTSVPLATNHGIGLCQGADFKAESGQ